MIIRWRNFKGNIVFHLPGLNPGIMHQKEYTLLQFAQKTESIIWAKLYDLSENKMK